MNLSKNEKCFKLAWKITLSVKEKWCICDSLDLGYKDVSQWNSITTNSTNDA